MTAMMMKYAVTFRWTGDYLLTAKPGYSYMHGSSKEQRDHSALHWPYMRTKLRGTEESE